MSLALQDFSREIDLLIRAGVVVLFLVIPIVRGVMESRRKQAEREGAKRAARQALEPDRQDAEQASGKAVWEQLLRGEVPSEAQRPPREAARKLQRPAAAPTSGPKLPRGPARAPLRPSPPVEPAPRPAPAAARSLEAPSRELAEAAAAPWNAPAALERARSAPMARSASLEESGRPAVALAPLGVMAVTAVELRRPLDPARAAEWRRAVVLAELLSPPIGLRPASAWPGAPLAG